MSLLKEFRPALMFLGKFLALYFVLNIVYGLYVEFYKNSPDTITWEVTRQTSKVLSIIGYDAGYETVQGLPKVALLNDSEIILYVFEGCNGVNVMIVFVAFLFAFGGRPKSFLFFLPAGLLIIHLVNLLRVSLLFVLAQTNSHQFYYYHKYLFTATLYLVTFALWYAWVNRFNERRKTTAAS